MHACTLYIDDIKWGARDAWSSAPPAVIIYTHSIADLCSCYPQNLTALKLLMHEVGPWNIYNPATWIFRENMVFISRFLFVYLWLAAMAGLADLA